MPRWSGSKPSLSKRWPDAPAARYEWKDASGRWQSLGTIDQHSNGDVFVLIGQAMLGENAEVRLGNNAGEPGKNHWVLYSYLAYIPN